MFINDDGQLKEQYANKSKELKVRIPVKQHLQLHGLKVTTGKLFSDVVAEALDAYFEALQQNRAGAVDHPVEAEAEASS